MRRSVTSVFSQMDDLRAAIGPECEFDSVLTRRGRFHARLTQVVLHRLRLTDLQENLPRIAFIRVPKDTILVALTVGNGDPQVWGGASIQVSDLVTLGPDNCVHARTDGPCRWGAIWFPLDHFDACGLALTGNVLRLPTRPSVWRPPPSVGRELHRLHAAAMQAGRLQSAALVDPEAAHGLEQQLIHVLIECLAGEPVKSTVPSTETYQKLSARLEELIRTHPDMGVAEIKAALGVTERTLRRSCNQQLAMGPKSYIRLCRLQQAHRDLCYGTPETVRISDVARRSGFRSRGRFAALYRDMFGELPSFTLRHSAYGAASELRSSGGIGRHASTSLN